MNSYHMDYTKSHHYASAEGQRVIDALPRRVEQPMNMRQYVPGYESYLALLPDMSRDDKAESKVTHAVLSELGRELITDPPVWVGQQWASFQRSILAIEPPVGPKESAEILVAHWPEGFTSPVHGHAAGYLYEQILTGSILVNTFRHVGNRTVRPLSSEVRAAGDILVSQFVTGDPQQERIAYPHSFTALTPADTLHFLPEHTRDTRDNAVTIERYGVADDRYQRLDVATAIHGTKPGDVALVRTQRVPELGDHWVIITGGLQKNFKGKWRPQERSLTAPNMRGVLDQYAPDDYGMVFLKLANPQRFYEFHGMEVSNGNVVFPKA